MRTPLPTLDELEANCRKVAEDERGRHWPPSAPLDARTARQRAAEGVIQLINQIRAKRRIHANCD